MSNSPAHHRTSDTLGLSTAITPVSDEAMDHAGQQAALLVQSAVMAKPPKAAKRARDRLPDARQSIQERLHEDVVAGRGGPLEAPIDGAGGVEGAATFDPPEAETAARPTAAEIAVLGGEILLQGDPAAADTLVALEIDGEKIVVDRPPLARDAFAEFHGRFAKAFQETAEASLAYWLSLMSVKSPVEAMELNDRYLRQRMTVFLSQGSELSALARKAAAMSITPVHGAG